MIVWWKESCLDVDCILYDRIFKYDVHVYDGIERMFFDGVQMGMAYGLYVRR